MRPFVYRRHLDYSAIAALRDLHSQIRREVENRDLLDNIKLGPAASARSSSPRRCSS